MCQTSTQQILDRSLLMGLLFTAYGSTSLRSGAESARSVWVMIFVRLRIYLHVFYRLDVTYPSKIGLFDKRWMDG